MSMREMCLEKYVGIISRLVDWSMETRKMISYVQPRSSDTEKVRSRALLSRVIPRSSRCPGQQLASTESSKAVNRQAMLLPSYDMR